MTTEKAKEKMGEKMRSSLDNIGTNIAKLREGAGMTQAQLAEIMGVYPSRISICECGLSTLRIETAYAFTKIFNVTFDSLLTGEEKRPSKDRPDHIDKEAVLNRMKELRKSKNLKQREFAQTCGLKRITISAHERGISFPIFRTAYKIAKANHVSLEWLIMGVE